MAKKKNELADTNDFMFGDNMELRSDMPEQLYTYEPLGITETRRKLEDKAKKLIEGIAKVYFQANELDESTYKSKLEEIESMNLQSLLMQVKYGEHMLSTLMTRLENGEHGDNSLYRLIMDLQNNQLSLTMTISQYIRNLPSFFKHLQKEMVEAGATSPIIDITNNKLEQKVLPNGQYNLDAPQKGMRDYWMQVEAELEKQQSENYIEDTENEE